MFYGYQIFTRGGYCMAEVCLQVILALDSNIGPRDNVTIQWQYDSGTLWPYHNLFITYLLSLYLINKFNTSIDFLPVLNVT